MELKAIATGAAGTRADAGRVAAWCYANNRSDTGRNGDYTTAWTAARRLAAIADAG